MQINSYWMYFNEFKNKDDNDSVCPWFINKPSLSHSSALHPLINVSDRLISSYSPEIFGLILKFERFNGLFVDVSNHCWTMTNSADSDQTPRWAASDHGLHCLLNHACPNTKNEYGIAPVYHFLYQEMTTSVSCKMRVELLYFHPWIYAAQNEKRWIPIVYADNGNL